MGSTRASRRFLCIVLSLIAAWAEDKIPLPEPVKKWPKNCPKPKVLEVQAYDLFHLAINCTSALKVGSVFCLGTSELRVKVLWENVVMAHRPLPPNSRGMELTVPPCPYAPGPKPLADSLGEPVAIAVDSSGTRLYVVDRSRHRVMKLPIRASGEAIEGTEFLVAGGRGAGDDANQLDRPMGLAILEGTSSVLVADTHNHRVQMWRVGAKSGTTVAGGRGQGSGPGQLHRPVGLAIEPPLRPNAPYSVLFVADCLNNRIVRYNGIADREGQVFAPSVPLQLPLGIHLGSKGTLSGSRSRLPSGGLNIFSTWRCWVWISECGWKSRWRWKRRLRVAEALVCCRGRHWGSHRCRPWEQPNNVLASRRHSRCAHCA